LDFVATVGVLPNCSATSRYICASERVAALVERLDVTDVSSPDRRHRSCADTNRGYPEMARSDQVGVSGCAVVGSPVS
jgi:hypothetical protein